MKKGLILTGMAIASLWSQNATAQGMAVLTNSNEIFVVSNISTPDSAGAKMLVTGLDTGQVVVSIDYRPATSELYGLGYNVSTNEAQLYVINQLSGATSSIGTPVILDLGSSQSISMDFNPAVDKVRVVGENGNNYRLDPVTGTIVGTDDSLKYAAGDINSGITPQIGAIAYTNSYVGASSTQLFNYDEALNVITKQDPPNSGTLNTIGGSGIILNTVYSTVGMDIYIDPLTLNNTAYLSANTDSNFYDSLYAIELTTGLVSNLGSIGNNEDVRDIAIQIAKLMPPLTGQMVYGLQKGTNNIFSFDSDLPNNVRSYTAVNGITAGQAIVGMDFRPATQQLYVLGYNDANQQSQLYTINLLNGTATAVASVVAMNLGAGGHIGFDFNPVTDEIRVVSTANRANYRLNPATGAISSVDANIAYPVGDVSAVFKANIGSIAYTNSYSGANTTALFGIDDSLGALVTIDPPNLGTVNTAAANFISLNTADRTSDIDFFYDSSSSDNIGFMTFNTRFSINDELYRYTVSGGLAAVNSIGLGISVADLAVQPRYKGALSVAETGLNTKALNIYPNPVNDQLFVSGSDISGAKATIFDMSGKVVRIAELKKNGISTEGLPAGSYILSINAKNNAFAPATFVKQ
jgi:hypothetical protein